MRVIHFLTALVTMALLVACSSLRPPGSSSGGDAAAIDGARLTPDASAEAGLAREAGPVRGDASSPDANNQDAAAAVADAGPARPAAQFGHRDFTEYRPGTLPIIIGAPHGGYLEPEDLPDLPDRHGRDNFTLETSVETAEQLHRLTGRWPHLIINHLHAKKLNAARAIDEAAGDNADARQAFEDFHRFIDTAKAAVTTRWGAGHYLDMHANGHADQWTEIGLGISPTLLNGDDEGILARCPRSTVANLCGPLGRPLLELVRGPTSLGGMLMEAGFRSVPSPEIPRPEDGGFFYAGWNTWRHGSRDQGSIDATHVESYWRFLREPLRRAYTEAIAGAMIRFMRLHYGLELLAP